MSILGEANEGINVVLSKEDFEELDLVLGGYLAHVRVVAERNALLWGLGGRRKGGLEGEGVKHIRQTQKAEGGVREGEKKSMKCKDTQMNV